MTMQLAQAIPNWREIAANPNWERWLDACNPATGRVRRDQFNAAIEQGDIGNVVATVQRFQQQQREGWPIREIGQGLKPRAAVPFYSRDQIKQNYARHRRGELVGPQWDRLEQEMFAAGREGRIFGGESLNVNGWIGT